MKTKSAAIITIKDAAQMTPKGRKKIAAWIRKTADLLEEEGKNLSGCFRARYLYTEK